jgi:pimeloyl-ACP methyl ester carboxylesterase
MPRPPRREGDAWHAPSDVLWATDLGRAFGEYGLLSLSLGPLLLAAPRGDGHPVLVLPGLLASDTSTLTLRTYLSYLGYHVAGWELGRNVGPTRMVVDGLLSRLEALAERRGQPASVIGWSLGGIFARELARRRPESVRQVLTLGSPFRMEHPDQAPAYRAYEVFTHLHVDPTELPPPEHARPPLSCPTTAVYSRWDGLVSWKTCLEEPGGQRENVAVHSSHLGYGHHPAVLWLVADRLAQAVGEWAPFRPGPLVRPLYPTNGSPNGSANGAGHGAQDGLG